MSTHPPTDRPAPYARFRFGGFECTVVSDGMLEMGPARGNFPAADPAEVDALLTDHHLSPEDVRLNENILIVDTGSELVQFDTGVGTDPALGRGFFGPRTGHAVPAMREAGIDPADIDVIALTHAHPDHAWGLVDPDGRPVYPNAVLAVSKAEFDHWTDLGKVGSAPDEHRKDHFRGAHKNLMPYAEAGRIRWVEDGDEVATGIRAVATPGHSPGHVVYTITSGDETMVCWGDLCHHQVLLLQRPDWAFQFDFDGPGATAQRRRIYELVDEGRHAVLGYHFPFPGLGHLRRDRDGYTWLPSELERALPVTADVVTPGR